MKHKSSFQRKDKHIMIQQIFHQNTGLKNKIFRGMKFPFRIH